MLYTAQLRNVGPISIRYPRGNCRNQNWQCDFEEIPIGKARCVVKGEKVARLSIGTVGYIVDDAMDILHKENITPSHYDMRFVKPLDEELLTNIFWEYSQIITIEDNALQGGFGSAILEFAADKGFSIPVKRFGIPDKFIEHGKQSQLHKVCGYDAQSLCEYVRDRMS